MNIQIVNKENKYFAVITNYKTNIKGYSVSSSDGKYLNKVDNINYNLLKEKIDLYNNDLDLINFEIELPPIYKPDYYYNIYITTEDGNCYPFYIDINKFYNLKQDDKIYYYDFDDDFTLKDESQHMYDFYLLGNFNDKHKVKLLQIINNKYILFTIPKEDEYISEIYSLIVELNNQKVYKCPFPIFKGKDVEFVIGMEDYGQYLKYTVSPKYNYSFIKKIVISDDYKILSTKVKKNKNKEFIKHLHFYLENPGINNFSNFKVEYTIQENYIGALPFKKAVVIKKNIYSKEEFNINDFESLYNFENDTYELSWKNKYMKKVNYRITLDDKETFYTSENSLSIPEMKKRNNNKKDHKIAIACDVSNNFYELFETNITNYYFLDSPFDFNPIIDYSDFFKEKKTANIKWTNPSYKYTAKIKLNVSFVNSFLNEYIEPWRDEYLIEKPVKYFDSKYHDYHKELPYDFDDTENYLIKSPSNCPIGNENKLGFINVGETNHYELPIWFCDVNGNYEVTVQIYDRWGQKRGETTTSFLTTTGTRDMEDNHIWIDRGQNIQFGEAGTIGRYFALDNPTPYDIKYLYAPEYKRYEGAPLHNYTNVDSNNVSLYYYFSVNNNDKVNNPDNELTIKYKRYYNFYKLTYEILYGDLVVVPVTKSIPNGNTFADNRFKISKSVFRREGEYTMRIKTFSSTNQESSMKEIKFYVYNEKPKKPLLEINSEDFYYDEDKNIIINKKYFSMKIINNSISEKYAGWNYKEVHFYFKKKSEVYNNYPDYVVLASRDNGEINFKNSLPIENGEYNCKIIAYDYSGNESEPYEFDFELISNMEIIPEKLFVNKIKNNFKWKIKKSQDSEGYYWQFKYSSDGITYEYTNPTKVFSPYRVNDPNSKIEDEIKLHWIEDLDTGEMRKGYYHLVIYEWNYRHPDGLQEYKFESPRIEVLDMINPSNPINARSIENKVAVFNKKDFNEYSYTDDLNNLIFDTIHNESVLDDGTTSDIEGQHYKIKLIEPSTGNEYECDLPVPTEVGIYTFDKIAEKCNIDNQIEGVWELHFITIDKYGNDNSYKGYYVYHINLVKTKPRITAMFLNNKNNSEYFNISSEAMGVYVETDCYNHISNYQKYQDMFEIKKFKITFLSTPDNRQYEIHNFKNNKKFVQIMDPLNLLEKSNHTKDGRYLISITAIDPLNRKSDAMEKIFYIDTNLDSTLTFLNPTVFFNKEVNLYASADVNASVIYYKKREDISNLVEEDYTQWNQTRVGEISIDEDTFNGCKINNLTYETDGLKTLVYKIKEVSGNITDYFYYNFSIDSSVKLSAIFDFNNKVFYTNEDKKIHITWNLSSKDIKKYEIKLDKIEISETGNEIIVNSYNLSVKNDGMLVPVGPSKNQYIDWGNKTECDILINENTFLAYGLFKLTVKAISKYEEIEFNDFKFQLDMEPMQVNIPDIINKNTVTINSNRISWSHINNALFYELSYDNKNFFRTINNYFMIDIDKIITDNNNRHCIYMRWKNKSGRYSETAKILLNVISKVIKTPKVYFKNKQKISDNNNILEWIVEVEEPETSKYIYYSFDNEHWNVKKVTGRKNVVSNNDINIYPVEDGEYGIFLRVTDNNPISSEYYSKSEMVYSSIEIFAQSIPTPTFLGLSSGITITEPQRLFITNKKENVAYYIYVNGRRVQEGYELNSSTLKKFDITVKAKKHGIDKIYNLINVDDNFHVWCSIEEKYTLNINGELISCYISESGRYIEIFSMPEKRDNQIILYKDKDFKTDNWKILKVGDQLSLLKQWEFHIATFDIYGGDK